MRNKLLIRTFSADQTIGVKDTTDNIENISCNFS